jgi:hypothetical protein
VRQATILVLFLPVLVLAGTGAAFLKIPVGPRVCGTGEAAASACFIVDVHLHSPACRRRWA